MTETTIVASMQEGEPSGQIDPVYGVCGRAAAAGS